MEEWTERQVQQWISESDERLFIYFYTPMCGTCKVTERMLQVIVELEKDLPLVKCNINFCPELAQSWQLESVPCIVSIEDHHLMRKRYRMQAVDDLLRWFQQTG
ncbi:thioredoxin family protein [Paenibacillus sp. UNC451MF]|uniref:thioredoxin family protein n=1 Tax=Paenibacillus sp. UNC451MF TaxID=1449063 RepID=UPI00048DEB11|nr:thioredoxin family protein [Paenibacillus sp. UNC451MF]